MKRRIDMRVRLGLLGLALLGLSACEDGRLQVELAADKAADATLLNVYATLDGVTLQRDDGRQDRIRLDTPATVDLLRYDRFAYTLVSDAALDSGTYTSLRLDFADPEASGSRYEIVTAGGGRRALTLAGGDAFIPLDLKVKKQGKTYVVQARLDLRLSLSDVATSPLFAPVIRATRDSRAATVSGTVRSALVTATSCRQNRASGVGVAVYAFADDIADPDDYDGSAPDPVATAAVSADGSGGWTYRIDTLAPGTYTLALTCDGDREDPLDDDSDDNDPFEFVDGTRRTVTLDAGDDKTRDLD